jgi:hypothetical protein
MTGRWRWRDAEVETTEAIDVENDSKCRKSTSSTLFSPEVEPR